MEELDKYIGKTIEIFIFDSGILSFVFKDGIKLDLYAEGDCCSTSWFEQIAGAESLENGAILFNIEFININDVIDNNDYDDSEVIKYYGIKIKTSLGYADIDMRNSSNGYYGGSISINGSCYSIYPN